MSCSCCYCHDKAGRLTIRYQRRVRSKLIGYPLRPRVLNVYLIDAYTYGDRTLPLSSRQ
jgi:hypothetical protein